MRATAAALALALLLTAAGAHAHPAPNSVVQFDFLDRSVVAELLLPASELAYVIDARHSLPDYLRAHVAAETPEGAAWRIALRSVRETTYLEHPYLLVTLELTPPSGSSARHFVFVDDAVTHEVRNHVVVVVSRSDATQSAPEFLGALQYPARRLTVQRP